MNDTTGFDQRQEAKELFPLRTRVRVLATGQLGSVVGHEGDYSKNHAPLIVGLDDPQPGKPPHINCWATEVEHVL